MAIKFTNPTPAGWSTIARRIVERGHITPAQNEPKMLGDRDFTDKPFTIDDARAEALKWNWQH